MTKFKPPPKVSTNDWANTYRFLSEKSSARPGKYNSALTPWIKGMLDAIDDPSIYKVVCRKSAQVAWTDGVMNNYIGKRIHIDPAPMLIMFPKEGDAKGYSRKKFKPMIDATPVLRDQVNTTLSRTGDNTQLYKEFDGGYIQFVGSNSTGNVKSDPVPIVAIEEPDDCSVNIKDQGDAIGLIMERTKTFTNRKILFGGTPKVKGLSRVDEEYEKSDQREFYIPCHECGESHVLNWDNVRWQDDEGQNHSVYGSAMPGTAFYTCPHNGCCWSDLEKNRNVRRGKWIAKSKTEGVAGFYINELYSPFDASKFENLVKKYLEAKHSESKGDDKDIIVFVNSTLGLAYEYKDDNAGADEIQAMAEDYQELVCPANGLAVTAGIDVQHDRLAIIIRAYGRGMKSWLLYWGEISADVGTHDKKDPVWTALDNLLFSPFKHEKHGTIRLSALTIDSSDGTTSAAVYDWVRSRQQKHRRISVMAGKGDSNDFGKREIFSHPRKIDHKNPKKATKADKHGVQVYMIGTHKAKDLIRKRLSGTSSMMHTYQDVRVDYFDQVTAEVKAPSRTRKNLKVWQLKSGRRNEATDCEVYALHAAYAIRLNIDTEKQWGQYEARLLQSDLFKEQADEKTADEHKPKQTTRKRPRKNRVLVNKHKKAL